MLHDEKTVTRGTDLSPSRSFSGERAYRLTVYWQFIMLAAMKLVWTVITAAYLARTTVAQTSGAPAPAATATLYQRPNNSDCVSTTSSTTNYFPLQYQIAGSTSGSSQQEQVNVRLASMLQLATQLVQLPAAHRRKLSWRHVCEKRCLNKRR